MTRIGFAMDKALMAGLSTALMVAGLAGCSDASAPPVEANPDMPPGIEISDGRMNLPAVPGNPGAVYFTIDNYSDKDTTIVGAYVDGAASAEMHLSAESDGAMTMEKVEGIPIPAGDSFTFEPGSFHIMAMNVDPALKPGGETEVTLTFEGGDKASFKARLLAPGDEG